MLGKHPTRAMLPASDYERAKRFYGETLGLEKVSEIEGISTRYRTGDTFVEVYPSEYAGTNRATAVVWEVEDLDKVVEWLTGQGVSMLQYEFPEWRTDERGIADFGPFRGAWFKDTEGNIVNLGESVAETPS